MIKLSTYFIAIAFVMLAATSTQAQCKMFTKKKCMNTLAEYTSNGQYNGAVMFEGEEATLMQTFYSGKNYKLVVCAHPTISDGMYFEINDYRGNPIYSSEDSGNPEFEFNVQSTQQLKIRIVVPDQNKEAQIKKNGCVSVLVGFQEN